MVVPDLDGAARACLRSVEQAAAGDELARANHEWMVVELLDQVVRTESRGQEGTGHDQSELLANHEFVRSRIGDEFELRRAGRRRR